MRNVPGIWGILPDVMGQLTYEDNCTVPTAHDTIITSLGVKTMLRCRFDVIMTLFLRRVSAGVDWDIRKVPAVTMKRDSIEFVPTK